MRRWEVLHLFFNTPGKFDELLERNRAGGAQQASEISIATKQRGTIGGKSVAIIAFDVMLDGRRVPVQATTTVNCLATASAGLLAIQRREEEAARG